MGDENDIIKSFKEAWAQQYKNFKHEYRKYPHPWEVDQEKESIQKQKELQDMIRKFQDLAEIERKRKNVCLLCGEEVPSNPMICKDCRRVFAAFKTILVEETPTE